MIEDMTKAIVGTGVFVLIMWGFFKTLLAQSRILGPMPQHIEYLMQGMFGALTFLGIVAIIVMTYRKASGITES